MPVTGFVENVSLIPRMARVVTRLFGPLVLLAVVADGAAAPRGVSGSFGTKAPYDFP